MEGLRHKVIELTRRREIDVLELEETWGFPRYLAGRIPIPVVVRLHGPTFLVGRARGGAKADDLFEERVRFEGSGIAMADAVSAPSEAVIRETRRYYGLVLADAEVIPNAMQPASDGDCWVSGGCEERTILFVGRFDRIKGADVAVESFVRVARDDLQARLVVCGPDRGFCTDDGRMLHIEGFLDLLSMPDDVRARIDFLGWQPPSRIAELRRSAAVTIAPSRFETFGYAILEAAAQGCPVIATRCGGPEEIIRDGETGLLVPTEDPGALADAIRRLLNDRGFASILGRAAWEDVRVRFDPIHIAEQTLAFYRRVIETHAARRR
jgi:glycosyltransferase involved in cell wall biosynthesis